MAYQSGSAADASALATAIKSFATTNGWVLTGNILSKGLSHAGITSSSSSGDDMVVITGYNSADGLTEPCPFSRAIRIATGQWPVSYELFAHSSPDMVICVVSYATVRVQVLMFGDIVKMHNDAFVGGNFFFATRSPVVPRLVGWIRPNTSSVSLVESGINTFTNGLSRQYVVPFPFTNSRLGSYARAYRNNGIHAKINGSVWDGTESTSDSTTNVFLTPESYHMIYNSPNTWNDQALLVPMSLQYVVNFTEPDAMAMYLGYIEHIRLVRLDNYVQGDFITLGSETWKVFPWLERDVELRNGLPHTSLINDNPSYDKSGTLGFAVRYDGA